MKFFIPLLLSLTFAAPVLAHDGEAVRLISVNGMAEQSFDPDKADITLNLEGEAKELKAAKAKHEILLKALYAVTDKYKIDRKKIETLSDIIQPRYEYPKSGKRILAGYVASHRVQIEFTQLPKLADFITDITNAKIDQIDGVNFGLLNSNTAEREVMLSALSNAKTKARDVAGAVAVKLGRVYSVNVQGGGGYQPQPMRVSPKMMMQASSVEMMSDASAPIPAGEIMIRQDVQAQFEIE